MTFWIAVVSVHWCSFCPYSWACSIGVRRCGAMLVILVVDGDPWSHWLTNNDCVQFISWLIKGFQLKISGRGTAGWCWALAAFLYRLRSRRSLLGLYSHFILWILLEPCSSEVFIRQVIFTANGRIEVWFSRIGCHMLGEFQVCLDLSLRSDLKRLDPVCNLKFVQLILWFVYQFLLLYIKGVFIILVYKLMHFRKLRKINFFVLFFGLMSHFLLYPNKIECLRNIIQNQILTIWL